MFPRNDSPLKSAAITMWRKFTPHFCSRSISQSDFCQCCSRTGRIENYFDNHVPNLKQPKYNGTYTHTWKINFVSYPEHHDLAKKSRRAMRFVRRSGRHRTAAASRIFAPKYNALGFSKGSKYNSTLSRRKFLVDDFGSRK